MRPKPADNQNLLFTARLEQILDHNHLLFKLGNAIDWFEFEEAFGKLYDPGQGQPAKPIRLMVGLHYLKHAYDLNDEDVVARWVENPTATRPANAIKNTAVQIAGYGPVTFVVTNTDGTISGNAGTNEANENPVRLYYYYDPGPGATSSPIKTVYVQQP